MKNNKFFIPIILLSSLCHAQYSVSDMRKVPFQRNNTPDKISDMHAADFNKDGNIDVVLDGGLPKNNSGFIEHNSKPIFFLGDGNGNLVVTPSTFAHSSTSSFISDVADYDNDGFADILVSDFWANGMRLYKGAAGLNYTLVQNLPTGTHGAKGKFEDMDGDGDLDIVNVSSGSAAVIALHVYDNNAGTFTKASYNSINNHDFAPKLIIADLNHDGRKDVFNIGSQGENINSWIQNADKSYTASIEQLHQNMHTGSNERFSYWLEDADNDGYQDLCFFNDLVDYSWSATTQVAYSRPSQPFFGGARDTFGLTVDDYHGASLQTAVIGDIDNDHVQDIVTDNFITPGSQDSVPQQLVVVIDPLNKNGNFMEQRLNLGWFLNFGGPQTLKTRGYGLLLADLDKDNDLELISAGIDDTLRIFNNSLNNGATAIGVVKSKEAVFSIYPNPSSNSINIKLFGISDKDIQSILIYDAKGAIIRTIKGETRKRAIDVQALSAGNYFLALKMNNGDSYTKIFNKK